MKDRVQSIREKQISSSKTSNFGWMKVAASVMILAVVGLGFYSQSYSNEKLYEDAYTPAGDYITNMDSEMSDMEKAIELFNKERFSEAVNAFAKIESREPLNQEAKFYLGQSLLQGNQQEQAIATLSEVTGSYRAEALWYAALTQLKSSKEEEDAKATLNKIIIEKTDSAFVIKAEKLLNKLNSPLRRLAL